MNMAGGRTQPSKDLEFKGFQRKAQNEELASNPSFATNPPIFENPYLSACYPKLAG
jgi:hypothetical protein